VIDLLWTGIGGLSGAELGMVGAWVADYGRKARRAWMRRYCIGLGCLLGAALGAGLTMPHPIETQLAASGPAFKAVHDRYPVVFAQMTAATRGMDKSDQAALQEKVRPLLVDLIQAHRSEMDDASAAAIGQLMLDETAALRDAKPEACVAALEGRPSGVDLRTVQGPELRRRDAEVTGALVEQLATRPATPAQRLTLDEDQRLSDHALAKLTSGERDTLAPLLLERRGPANAREAAAWCAFRRARLSAAMDAQPGTLRRLLAG
jgi:hypothetical protein